MSGSAENRVALPRHPLFPQFTSGQQASLSEPIRRDGVSEAVWREMNSKKVRQAKYIERNLVGIPQIDIFLADDIANLGHSRNFQSG